MEFPCLVLEYRNTMWLIFNCSLSRKVLVAQGCNAIAIAWVEQYDYKPIGIIMMSKVLEGSAQTINIGVPAKPVLSHLLVRRTPPIIGVDISRQKGHLGM